MSKESLRENLDNQENQMDTGILKALIFFKKAKKTIEPSKDFENRMQKTISNLESEKRTVFQNWFGHAYFIPATVIALIVLSLTVFIGKSYFENIISQKSNSIAQNVQNETKVNAQVAIHTYYKNNQPTTVIKEYNRRFKDGSLESVISSDSKILSRHLFHKNMILSLSNSVLTEQYYKTKIDKPHQYLTTGGNIAKYVKEAGNIKKSSSSLNGEKVDVYTIGEDKMTFFPFLKTAFAQDSDNIIVKVYLEEQTGDLRKIERIDSDLNIPVEVVDYTEDILLPPPHTPSITSSKSEENNNENTNNVDLPSLSQEDQLKSMAEKIIKDLGQSEYDNKSDLPIPEIAGEMVKEADEIEIIDLVPPVTPDEAIYINPISVIPTETSYNSPIMQLTSKIFNQQKLVDKEMNEKGGFDALSFSKKNVKVRIDGVEVANSEISLSNREMNNPNSFDVPWTVTFMIPKGLTPGYHTMEVYIVDSWYLAPNLLVALPKPDEKVAELQLNFDIPPVAVLTADNSSYKITLKGKNFSKPLIIYLDETKFEDNAVEVVNEEKLILTIPIDIPKPSHGPAYDLTIVKDGQKIFRPAFLLLGGPN